MSLPKSLVKISNPDFRPGTKTEPKDVIFQMALKNEKTAALGDMICWLSALKFVAETYDYVNGHVIVPNWFTELAANVLREYPNWRIHSEIPSRLENGIQLRLQIPDPANATGFHLLDLGAVYFAGIDRLPDEYRNYVQLNLEDVKLKKELRDIKYAVMTPVSESTNRKMLPENFNKIVLYLVSIGITPVFLGKSEMDRRSLSLSDEYDLSKGINLINKTTLLEAAKVMQKADFVLGIDNGLLHLAATTDVTIFYGYTIAGPKTRRIFRKNGHTIELYPDKEKLPCVFCQENVRFFLMHDFRTCIYKEAIPQCVKELDAESFIANIAEVVEQKLNEHKSK